MPNAIDISAKRRAAALARKTIGKSTGRPRSKKMRCVCGEMTARRAKARGHVCSNEQDSENEATA